MKKLFENVGGNNFKLLLSESIEEKSKLVESGLKKVFSNSDSDVSYKRVEAVGLGYIKDVNEAKRVSLDTAKRLCESLGFKDDEINGKFTKENSVDVEPYNPSAPKEEKREIQIGREILSICNEKLPYSEDVKTIERLASELIRMHRAN